MTVKSTGAGINKWNKAYWWVKLYQANGNKTRNAYKVKCPDVGDTYPRIVKSTPHHQQAHSPDEYKNRD
ncbi:MAG: hypothetical protein JWQ57_3711 [Mucilaginibacter sp.]|nr:hypothetical protein [Mucilaginibacter sp.]